jgi:hypothetical protein
MFSVTAAQFALESEAHKSVCASDCLKTTSPRTRCIGTGRAVPLTLLLPPPAPFPPGHWPVWPLRLLLAARGAVAPRHCGAPPSQHPALHHPLPPAPRRPSPGSPRQAGGEESPGTEAGTKAHTIFLHPSGHQRPRGLPGPGPQGRRPRRARCSAASTLRSAPRQPRRVRARFRPRQPPVTFRSPWMRTSSRPRRAPSTHALPPTRPLRPQAKTPSLLPTPQPLELGFSLHPPKDSWIKEFTLEVSASPLPAVT